MKLSIIFEVLRLLDIHCPLKGLAYELYPDDADREYVGKLLTEQISGAFVVLHPGCGDARKLKPAVFWASLASRFEEDLTVVVTGSATEAGLCSEITALVDRNIVGLTGITVEYGSSSCCTVMPRECTLSTHCQRTWPHVPGVR